MNYSYVLLQNEENEQNWYMILREYNEEAVIKAVVMFKEAITLQMLNGRQGLTLDVIEDLVKRNIENTIGYLSEGKILLVNRLGGHMFLENSHIILKEIESYTFPVLENDYINGLLSSDGEFVQCEYGHHHEIAEKIEHKDNKCISISHDPIGNNSAIFIGDSITDKQKKFLLSNLDRLDPVHIKSLKSEGII